MAPHSSPQPVRQADGPGEVTATLDDVDILSELASRPARLPDHESEDRALAALAKSMSEDPRNMLQRLVETAVVLCHADTAGVSLLEGPVFRWEAVAGVFASYRNGTMPREASPCGICINRDTTQLMYLPDRCFPALRAEPRFVEALLIPFHVRGTPIGTVWIVSHREDRKFDREDERIVRVLSQFASAGWQLWKAYEAAEEANHRKDEFLAMLGHELRNPLAAILSASSILKTRGALEPGALRAADVVGRQAQHMTTMIEDLLDVARITEGKLELHREPVELQAVVAHAAETTRAHIERRGHRLSIELPAEPIRLEADPVRLAQLVANLLDNAAKYTPDGGQISLVAEHVDGDVRMTVADTGIGIPPEQLGSVFDRSTQLGSPAGGLGLGLMLVKSLAELHGGTATAASAGVGKGSRFTVRLPVLPGARETPPAAQTVVTSAAVSRRILLVEDNDDVAEGLAMILSFDGHSVRVARDGAAAVAALKAFAPDVVLLDIGLPDVDGYEVARRMRAERPRGELTIIALSGFGQEQHRLESAAAGCDAHLVKPVDPAILREMLARASLA